MIKLSCCAPPEAAEAVKAAGFSGIEINIGQICSMSGEEFLAAERAVRDASLEVTSGNCFLPGDWPLGHGKADPEKDMGYLTNAADRLSRLGCRTAVLGSGGARALDEGFGLEKGRAQFMAFYRRALKVFGEKGLVIAIEPLRRAECNWLNSVGEAVELIRGLTEENRGITCDFYHVAQENEPLADVEAAGGLIRHCHIAHPVTRKAPLPGDGADYAAYARALEGIGYDGVVSLEADWGGDREMLTRCADYLKEIFIK